MNNKTFAEGLADKINSYVKGIKNKLPKGWCVCYTINRDDFEDLGNDITPVSVKDINFRVNAYFRIEDIGNVERKDFDDNLYKLISKRFSGSFWNFYREGDELIKFLSDSYRERELDEASFLSTDLIDKTFFEISPEIYSRLVYDVVHYGNFGNFFDGIANKIGVKLIRDDIVMFEADNLADVKKIDDVLVKYGVKFLFE